MTATPPLTDRLSYRPLLTLAAPTVLQMASYTVMQFVDSYMLANFGRRTGAGDELAAAAAGAGIISFSVIGFGMGVLFCVNTLVAQNFGQKNFRTCGQYLWQGNWFAVLFAIVAALTLPFWRPLFVSMGHSPTLAQHEATYAQLTIAFTAMKLVGTSATQFLIAINRPAVVLLSTVVAGIANFGFNIVLIYGHLGFKPMGLAGAAWGTNLALIVETSIVLGFCLLPVIRRAYNTLDWKPRLAEMRTLLRIGLPSGVQLVADVAAWSLFIVFVMHRVSETAMAANIYMFNYMKVSFMPAFGLGTAVTSLVGQSIGAGRPDLATLWGRRGLKITLGYMLACGVAFVAFRRPMIDLFTDDPETLRVGMMLMVFCCVYQFFDAVYIIYNGALRGAGDTFVPAVATIVLCWSWVVGGAYAVAALFPQFGAAGPWTVATAYGAVLGVWMWRRFERGRWKQIDLETSPNT